MLYPVPLVPPLPVQFDVVYCVLGAACPHLLALRALADVLCTLYSVLFVHLLPVQSGTLHCVLCSVLSVLSHLPALRALPPQTTQGWGKPPPSDAQDCDRVRYRTRGLRETNGGYRETWDFCRGVGPLAQENACGS